jgi:phosphoribosylanthranilate isomerase
VDIPADNIGLSNAYYGTNNESIKATINDMKQNILQLYETSKRRYIIYTKSEILNVINSKNYDDQLSEYNALVINN